MPFTAIYGLPGRANKTLLIIQHGLIVNTEKYNSVTFFVSVPSHDVSITTQSAVISDVEVVNEINV